MIKHAAIARAAGYLSMVTALAACNTVRDWREMRTAPMTLGACYDGISYIATQGRFREDSSKSDRGLGTWQSRWLRREKERNFPIRNRLKVEILVDEGSVKTGWPVRYVIEQEKITDLRRHTSPREDDWSADGQDAEGEVLFGERLVRRLAPKSSAATGAGQLR